jgi:hypothetical protein
MNNEPKRTSFMRYSRVNEILRSDNALSRRLSKKTVAVCKPDQTSEDFPVEVVFVTDEIHMQGIDAYTMPKIEVIRMAHRLLVANPQPIPAIVAPPAPQPKAKAAQAKKPVAAKAAKPDKPKVRRRTPAPKAPATADPRPAAVEPPKTGGKTEDRSPPPAPLKMPPEYVRPFVPYVPGCAMLSNLQAVLTLLEPYVAAGDADAKEVCQKVNELIDDIHRRTVLPSAKEEPTTTAG